MYVVDTNALVDVYEHICFWFQLCKYLLLNSTCTDIHCMNDFGQAARLLHVYPCSLTSCFTWCRVLRVSRVARIVRILRALPELLILVKVGPLGLPWTWHSHGVMGWSLLVVATGLIRLGRPFYLTVWHNYVRIRKWCLWRCQNVLASAHAESWVPFPFGMHKIDSTQSREATQLNKHDIFLCGQKRITMWLTFVELTGPWCCYTVCLLHLLCWAQRAVTDCGKKGWNPENSWNTKQVKLLWHTKKIKQVDLFRHLWLAFLKIIEAWGFTITFNFHFMQANFPPCCCEPRFDVQGSVEGNCIPGVNRISLGMALKLVGQWNHTDQKAFSVSPTIHYTPFK